MRKAIFFILFGAIICEWVEIIPISIKSLSGPDKLTTTENYETTMEAPAFHNVTIDQANDDNGNMQYKLEKRTSEYDEEDYSYENKNINNEGFLGLLRTLQNKMLKYKVKSPNGKMSLLKVIRDNLLWNIKHRMANLWIPKSEQIARGYKDDDYSMDFPSNEGALMTIGFLTFAVFLIKLVIKLVHLIKYKHQFYNMAASTTTMSSVLFLKRKGRNTPSENDDATQILQYIDDFNPNNFMNNNSF